MAKIKLTKGELKRQRDSLRQYQRYLPTLQLKKQKLQMEILHELAMREEKKNKEKARIGEIQRWIGLITDTSVDLRPWLVPKNILKEPRNIAGVDMPLFKQAEFSEAEYDLFITPLWVDAAIEALRGLVSIREELAIIEEGIRILRQELRITSQRVNLFEKVKIPEALEAIRLIKIYIGDQMANAVGRSKLAKRKIEEERATLEALV